MRGIGNSGASRNQTQAAAAGQQNFIGLNTELAKKWQPILQRKLASSDAAQWAKVKERSL
jgi:hypothetical protein